MRPIKYRIAEDLYLEDRDPEQRYPDRPSWAITRHGSCLNRDGEFEHEPMPSNRDEAFLVRCRYTFEEAQALIVAMKGYTPVMFVENQRWFFWDETWTRAIGPYRTEAECKEALKKYGESL